MFEIAIGIRASAIRFFECATSLSKMRRLHFRDRSVWCGRIRKGEVRYMVFGLLDDVEVVFVCTFRSDMLDHFGETGETR
jgi:hypothetical protein